jgi:hypothetical protein
LFLMTGCKQEASKTLPSSPVPSSNVEPVAPSFTVKTMPSKVLCPGQFIRMAASFSSNSTEKEKTRYFYNSKNQLDSIATNNSGTKYLYKNNQLVETWDYDAPNEPVLAKNILTYNAHHQLEKVMYFYRDEKGDLPATGNLECTLEYDKEGNLIKKNHFLSGDYFHTYLYEWKNGNMVFQKDYNGNELEQEWRMVYDDKINPMPLDFAALTEPYSRNNRIKRILKDYTGRACQKGHLPRYLYKYNKDGLPIESQTSSFYKQFFEYECF